MNDHRNYIEMCRRKSCHLMHRCTCVCIYMCGGGIKSFKNHLPSNVIEPQIAAVNFLVLVICIINTKD